MGWCKSAVIMINKIMHNNNNDYITWCSICKGSKKYNNKKCKYCKGKGKIKVLFA